MGMDCAAFFLVCPQGSSGPVGQELLPECLLNESMKE